MAEKESGRSVSWMVTFSSVLMVAVVIAVGIHLVKNAPSKKSDGGSAVLDEIASAAALEASRKITENEFFLNDKGVDLAKESVDNYRKFDLSAIDKRFVSS